MRGKVANRRNVAHLADSAKRSLRDGSLLELGAHEACGMYAFGLNHAGVDGVDARSYGHRALLARTPEMASTAPLVPL